MGAIIAVMLVTLPKREDWLIVVIGQPVFFITLKSPPPEADSALLLLLIQHPHNRPFLRSQRTLIT